MPIICIKMEQQPSAAKEPQPPADEAAKQLSPTAIEQIRRFCYISNHVEPVYVAATIELKPERKLPALRQLCAKVSANDLIDCLCSVFETTNSECLPRRDEALLVLAVYLSTVTNDKQRKAVRECFAALVRSDTDLFMFIRFVKQLQKLLKRKTLLCRTVRKAVLAWYKLQSVANIILMWSSGNNHAHSLLLYRCHYTTLKYETNMAAALRLFGMPSKEIVQWPAELHALNYVKDVVVGIAELRMAETSEVALPIIKRLKLQHEQVPRHLLYDKKISEEMLPTMSYEQLLKSWSAIKRYYVPFQALQRRHTDLYKNEAKMREGNVEPLIFFLQQERNEKDNNVHTMSSTKLTRRTLMPCLYKMSFGLNKPLGQRMHITLNLEKFYLKQHFKRHWRSFRYLDVLVAIAFGYFKSETDAKVHFWHGREGQLKSLPWTQEMSVAEAKSCCEENQAEKPKQALTDIFNHATNDVVNTYDLFLVVVPAATRGNTMQCSKKLCAQLDKYREKRNPNAKLIIMSLFRFKGSMGYSSQRNENVLELCSINEHTSRIIKAFAREKFY